MIRGPRKHSACSIPSLGLTAPEFNPPIVPVPLGPENPRRAHVTLRPRWARPGEAIFCHDGVIDRKQSPGALSP